MKKKILCMVLTGLTVTTLIACGSKKEVPTDQPPLPDQSTEQVENIETVDDTTEPEEPVTSEETTEPEENTEPEQTVEPEKPEVPETETPETETPETDVPETPIETEAPEAPTPVEPETPVKPEESAPEEPKKEEPKKPSANEPDTSKAGNEAVILTYEDFEILGENTYDTYEDIYGDVFIGTGIFPTHNGTEYSNYIDYAKAANDQWFILFRDNFTTSRGIGIGNSLKDIVAAYGDDYEYIDNGYDYFNTDKLKAKYRIAYSHTLEEGLDCRITFNMTAENTVMSIHYELVNY